MLHAKQLAVIGAIVFGGAALIFFGEDLLYEKLHISFLIFIAVLFHRNINLLTVVAVTGIGNVIGVVVHLPVESIEHQWWFRFLVYAFVLITLFRTKSEVLKIPVLVTVVCCLVAEGYWLLIDYQAPLIYWYTFTLCINLLIRYFFWKRVFIVAKHFPDQAKPLDADIFLYDLVRFYVYVLIAIIFEYFLRHVFNVQVTYIYYASDYIFSALTILSSLVIAREGYIVIKRDWLSA